MGHVWDMSIVEIPIGILGRYLGCGYMGVESRVWAKAEAWEFKGVDGLTLEGRAQVKGFPWYL